MSVLGRCYVGAMSVLCRCYVGPASVLLGGHRCDRSAEAVAKRCGGCRQQHVVLAVGGAVVGERVEVPVLALQQPDVHERQHVNRHKGVVALSGEHFEGEVVRCGRADIVAPQPAQCLHSDPRRGEAVVDPATRAD